MGFLSPEMIEAFKQLRNCGIPEGVELGRAFERLAEMELKCKKLSLEGDAAQLKFLNNPNTSLIDEAIKHLSQASDMFSDLVFATNQAVIALNKYKQLG